jgi:hypothetical protein
VVNFTNIQAKERYMVQFRFIPAILSRGLCAALICAASVFGADVLYIKGQVTTNDGFPGSDLVVSLKTTAVACTTDTAGSFSLPLPVTALVFDKRNVPHANLQNDSPVSLFLSDSRKQSIIQDNKRYFDLTGRMVDLKNIISSHTQTGVYIRETIRSNNSISTPISKGAVEFSDTLIVAYCDSIQKKMAVSLSDTGKNLQITLVNDLAPKRHRFLAASYSNNAAYVVSPTNTIETTYKMPGPVQDAWKLANGHILLCGADSVREVDANNKIIWGYKSPCGGEMHNCQPLPGGKRFFGENCSGKLFIADSQGTATAVPKPQLKDLGADNNHSRFRMVRKYDSLYLVTAKGEEVVYMFNSRGDTLRKINDAKLSRFGVTFNAVHSAILLPGGNILIGSGYTGFFVEVDKRDSVVWKVSAADLPGIGLNYAAGCQRLRNGNTICATYSSTVKFFEISHKKRVVWTSNAGGFTGNPTHIFLLDIAGDPAKGELLR